VTEHAWWKQESARSDLLVAIDHFNSAREQADWPRPGWEVDACADMFKGLDKLWSLREQILGPYPTAEGKPASDLRQFKELLKGVGEAAGADLLDSGPVRELAAFGPPILDHTEPGMTQRPLAELPEDLRDRAGRAHRDFRQQLQRWSTLRANPNPTLAGLAHLLSKVRNNLMHGEKTRSGPDIERTQRNRAVARVILATAQDVVDAVLEHPSKKLVAYGTLRPDGANHSLIPKPGAWSPATIRGVVGEVQDLPAFIPDPSGELAPADVLVSGGLPSAWAALDQAEGSRYRRALIWFDGDLSGVGYIYALAER